MTESSPSGRNFILEDAVNEVTARYVAANKKSAEHYQAARQSLPGGNTRSGMFYSPFPLAVEKASGATLTDIDGHEYTDFVGDFTAGLYGHSHPIIREAVLKALDAGMVYGSSSPYEQRLATLVCERFPSIERVRFTNSGTEANMMALVTARAITNKDRILVFEGGYHGSTISFGSSGSPINAPFEFVLAPYNDPDSAVTLIKRNASKMAAVLVEPMQGASGSIAGTDEFLQVLREACSSSGVLLIFDEVMTSRLGPNGRQGQIDVIPDITTLGKYVGGGISFGAFGGSAEIMDRYDPSVPSSFVHHGTFNNNVFMLMAGAAGLEKILTLDAQNSLNSSGDDLRITLNSVAQRHHASFQTSGLGSIMTMHFQSKPIKSIRDIESRDPRLRQLLHLDLIDKGFFTTRRGFMALSLAITDQNRNDFITAINEFLSQYGMLLESSP